LLEHQNERTHSSSFGKHNIVSRGRVFFQRKRGKEFNRPAGSIQQFKKKVARKVDAMGICAQHFNAIMGIDEGR